MNDLYNIEIYNVLSFHSSKNLFFWGPCPHSRFKGRTADSRDVGIKGCFDIYSNNIMNYLQIYTVKDIDVCNIVYSLLILVVSSSILSCLATSSISPLKLKTLGLGLESILEILYNSSS